MGPGNPVATELQPLEKGALPGATDSEGDPGRVAEAVPCELVVWVAGRQSTIEVRADVRALARQVRPRLLQRYLDRAQGDRPLAPLAGYVVVVDPRSSGLCLKP